MIHFHMQRFKFIDFMVIELRFFKGGGGGGGGGQVATTDILMDDVDCDGSETSLLQRNYDSSHNCNYENSFYCLLNN